MSGEILWKFIGMVVLSLLTLGPAHSSTVPLSRYTTATNGLKPYQINLLSQSISIQFKPGTQTIGQAIQQVMAGSGYRLVPPEQQSQTAQMMLANPFPVVWQRVDNATLQQVLSGLTGNHFDLVVDPVRRLLAFKLKPGTQQLYQHKELST